jgi:hypothetical protein
MIDTLLDAGADVTVANRHGLTAFHYAIYRREPEALEYLITACSERILEAFSYSYPQQHDLHCIEKTSRRIASSFVHGLELNMQLKTCLENGMPEPCCAYNFIQYTNQTLEILRSAAASKVLPFLTLTQDDEDSIFAELSTWHSSESDASPEYSDDDDYYSSSSDEYDDEEEDEEEEEEEEDSSSSSSSSEVAAPPGNTHLVLRLSSQTQAIDSPPWWSTYAQS